jgi:hypothetical protein
MAAVAVAAATTLLSAGAVAHADEPAVPDTTVSDSTVPDSTVPTGEFNGAEVAVDVPPVPPTSVEVAVDVPPVPPTSVEVAVDVPPVPPVTIPDAAPIVASEAPVPAAVPQHRADEQPAAGPQLPETGAAAARATAIVAGAAVSIGAALKALANRA